MRRLAERRRAERLTETGVGMRFLSPTGEDITQKVLERSFDSQVRALPALPADVLRATMN